MTPISTISTVFAAVMIACTCDAAIASATCAPAASRHGEPAARVALELPVLALVSRHPDGISVGPAGWRIVALEPVAPTNATELGLSRGRPHEYYDTEREVLVVAGTLTTLTTISLLTFG